MTPFLTNSDEFLTTWQEQTAEQQLLSEQQQTTQDRRHTAHVLSQEELRLHHLNEPLTPMVGSVQQSRQLLRAFEAKLPTLRSGLAAGSGWIEIFSVPKRRYTPEVMAYGYAWATHLDHGSPLPPDIEQAIDPRIAACIQQHAEFPRDLRDLVSDITDVGPYATYRWKEQKQTDTISLGLISDYPPFPFSPAGF